MRLVFVCTDPLHFLELFLPGIELSPNGGRLLVARLELEREKTNEVASSIRKDSLSNAFYPRTCIAL